MGLDIQSYVQSRYDNASAKFQIYDNKIKNNQCDGFLGKLGYQIARAWSRLRMDVLQLFGAKSNISTTNLTDHPAKGINEKNFNAPHTDTTNNAVQGDNSEVQSGNPNLDPNEVIDLRQALEENFNTVQPAKKHKRINLPEQNILENAGSANSFAENKIQAPEIDSPEEIKLDNQQTKEEKIDQSIQNFFDKVKYNSATGKLEHNGKDIKSELGKLVNKDLKDLGATQKNLGNIIRQVKEGINQAYGDKKDAHQTAINNILNDFAGPLHNLPKE